MVEATLSLSSRLAIEGCLSDIANMGGSGMDELRWHIPVRPGDTLSVRLEVIEKTPSESRSDHGYIGFKRHVYNDSGEEVMTTITHNIVRRRRTRGD